MNVVKSIKIATKVGKNIEKVEEDRKSLGWLE